MSSSNHYNRRHVQAKRRHGNPPTSTLDFLQVQGNSSDYYRRGNKRNFQQIQTPPCSRKNIASERMKRLRDSITKTGPNTQSYPNNRILRSPNSQVNNRFNRQSPTKQASSTLVPKNNNNRRRSPTKISPLTLRLERARRTSIVKTKNKRRAKDALLNSDPKRSNIGDNHDNVPGESHNTDFVPTNFIPTSTYNFGRSTAPSLQAAPAKIPNELLVTASTSSATSVGETTTTTTHVEKMEWDTNPTDRRGAQGTFSSNKNAPDNEEIPREIQFNMSRASLNWAELTESPPININCDVYIVVDTNIFISHLQLIRIITEINLTGSGTRPIIYIPWIVLEELDYLKSGSDMTDVKWKAQDAVKFINRSLQSKSDRIIGQTVDEVLQQRNTGIKQDDKILSCCLQIKENHKNIILLSNDINLKNKALINNVQTCSHFEIIGKINRTFKKAPKSDQILGLMTILCSNVIKKCALKTYGDNWDKLHMLQTPPQSIDDCIRVFKKYWVSLFHEVLMKQFQKAMIDLSTFLTQNTDIKDNNREALNKLTTLCIRICLFLKDVNLDRNLVENTIRDINEIKELN